MNKFIKVALVAQYWLRYKNCSYDYLLHPAISISKIIGGCGPTAQ